MRGDFRSHLNPAYPFMFSILAAKEVTWVTRDRRCGLI